MPDGSNVVLPEHSDRGASSASRWMNCPGSVTLIRSLGPDMIEDDPDYRTLGTLAHKLAAHCLEADVDCWEVMGDAALPEIADIDDDMASAVQTYLDFCRTLPGQRYIETRVHRPEFHPAFFGTLDFAAVSIDTDNLHFVDYKHGVGIVVDVVENPQLKYYAYGFIGEDAASYPDESPVKLTIVQPRGFHHDGAIRTWETTAGAIREWANGTLKPAMEATETEHYVSMGSWCRFCPAKIVCPAMNNLARKAVSVAPHHHRVATMQALDPDLLGKWYEEVECLKMIVKARTDEVKRRLLQGGTVTGVKLVYAKVDRIFKADAPVEATFGADAWDKPKPASPAKIEKLLGGKDFVAEWAFKPIGALTVALEHDSRTAVAVQPTEDKFKAALAAMETAE